MLVTDLSRDVAGRFCTRLLALGGADVVSYRGSLGLSETGEQGGAATGASAPDWLDAYLGSHKWDLDDARFEATGQDTAAGVDIDALRALVRASDVVVTSFDRGRYLGPFDAGAVRDLNPGAVHVTTSSFGTEGPYAAWRGGSLADWAAGGYLYITGDPSREPLCGPENLCGYVGGYTAAQAVHAGVLRQQRTGQGSHIDVSVMASMLSMHQSTFSRLGVGILRMRTGRITEVYPLTVLPCRDGHVSLGVVLDDEFDRFTLAIGRPEMVGDPRFSTPAARMVHREAFDAVVLPWLAAHEANQVVGILQAAGIPCSKVAGATEVLANPQLAARGFWEQISVAGTIGRMPGTPVRASGLDVPPEGGPLGPEGLRSIIAAYEGAPNAAAPAAGVTRVGPAGLPGSPGLPGSGEAGAPLEAGLPLQGDPPILVLDLTAFWAGPSATRNLADLGARVVRVERPRSRVDFGDNSDVGALVGHLFDRKMNRGKESMVLDLRAEAGKEVLRALAARADVLVENYRAGVMDRLGLGYEALSAAHPELVYVSLSGFGSSGPWSPWRSYGPTIEAASSIEARTGYVGGEPLRLGHTLPDGVGGLVGTLAALDGLRRRNLTGQGGHYDISQLEAYCALSGEGLLEASVSARDTPRSGNRGHGVSPHGVYPCRGDDQWIALAVANDDEWARCVTVMAADGLDADRFRCVSGRVSARDELDRKIAAWTVSADKAALALALQAVGVEAFPVATAADLVQDLQLEQRGYFVEVPFRGEMVRLPGSPLSSTPPIVRCDGRSPSFGEHSSAVVHTLAGYEKEQVAQLARDGIVVLGG